MNDWEELLALTARVAIIFMPEQPYLLSVFVFFIFSGFETHLADRVLIPVIHFDHMVLFRLFPCFLLTLVFLMMSPDSFQLFI